MYTGDDFIFSGLSSHGFINAYTPENMEIRKKIDFLLIIEQNMQIYES